MHGWTDAYSSAHVRVRGTMTLPCRPRSCCSEDGDAVADFSQADSRAHPPRSGTDQENELKKREAFSLGYPKLQEMIISMRRGAQSRRCPPRPLPFDCPSSSASVSRCLSSSGIILLLLAAAVSAQTFGWGWPLMQRGPLSPCLSSCLSGLTWYLCPASMRFSSSFPFFA